MATSHSKKRKSRSHEKYDESEGNKKRKKSTRDSSKGRHAKNSSMSSSGRSKPGKVLSVSELVRLVMAGEIKVPQRLSHYVEDRGKLLDQVFTILPESDVEDMIPATLKGLRFRQVKQVCLEQLKKLSTDEVMEIIKPPDQSAAVNVDAAVFELMGEQSGLEVGREGGRESQGHGSRGREEESTGGDGGGEVRGEGGGRGERGTESGGKNSTASGAVSQTLRRDSHDQHSQHGHAQTEWGGERDESTSFGSNGSKDEGKAQGTLNQSSLTHQAKPQTMECDTTTREATTEPSSVKWSEEKEISRTSSVADGSVSDNSSVCSLEDYWLSDFPAEVSEAARLQEIEFRKRALEAELRREEHLEERSGEEEQGEKEEVEEEEEEEEEGREDEEHEEGEGEMETGSSNSSVKVDKMGALELQLRQRALQSLLAKKKEQHL